jgi:hypothetical protein
VFGEAAIESKRELAIGRVFGTAGFAFGKMRIHTSTELG